MGLESSLETNLADAHYSSATVNPGVPSLHNVGVVQPEDSGIAKNYPGEHPLPAPATVSFYRGMAAAVLPVASTSDGTAMTTQAVEKW